MHHENAVVVQMAAIKRWLQMAAGEPQFSFRWGNVNDKRKEILTMGFDYIGGKFLKTFISSMALY